MSSDAPTRKPLLVMDSVSRSFATGDVVVKVLRQVSMNILDGEILAIVGPSGSGKTTILNLVGGLDSPSAGSLRYRDQDLTTATRRELTRYRRHEVGFVFQFYNLVPNLTARENVLVATDLSDNPLDVDEVLSMVGLQDRANHFPAQLSGGEQQRVAIARAIAKRPAILLCDEPTGALDFQTGKSILRLLVDLNRKMGMTVVVITHNSALAAVADRVIQLRSGEIVGEVHHPNPVAPEDVTW